MKNRFAIVTALLVLAGCGGQEPAKPKVAPPAKDGLASTDGAVPAKDDSKPAQDKAATTPTKTVALTKPRVKPTETMSITAEAFGDDIRKGAAAAAKKYEPVFVELTGVVSRVGTDYRGPFVTLDAGPESLGVVCVLAQEKEPWAKVSRGQKVKLRGLWPDLFNAQPELAACELVDVGTNPAVELKAEALAEEFDKNKDATRKKYEGKPLIVTGVVVDAKRNDLGAVRLLMRGASDARVDCGFDVSERAEAESQKLGNPVRVVGEFSAFESIESPALRGCRVITGK